VASDGQLRMQAALTGSPLEDLSKLGREDQIETIRYCRDSYKVTT
jgi:hypothetical protein